MAALPWQPGLSNHLCNDPYSPQGVGEGYEMEELWGAGMRAEEGGEQQCSSAEQQGPRQKQKEQEKKNLWEARTERIYAFINK